MRFLNKEEKILKLHLKAIMCMKHASILFEKKFKLHSKPEKEYFEEIIKDDVNVSILDDMVIGIRYGFEYKCKHTLVNRVRVLLTGADLYRVTVWKNIAVNKNTDGKVVQLFDSQENRIQDIDRIFNMELEHAIEYLFGYALKPEESNAWNVESFAE